MGFALTDHVMDFAGALAILERLPHAKKQALTTY